MCMDTHTYACMAEFLSLPKKYLLTAGSVAHLHVATCVFASEELGHWTQDSGHSVTVDEAQWDVKGRTPRGNGGCAARDPGLLSK